jgi:alanine racemase
LHRSQITIDLGAVRRNVRRLIDALDGAELWAVVKANGYGHGAVDVGRVALEAGARALCVVTLGEALELRERFPEVRLLVMGPLWPQELREAREARLELAVGDGKLPQGLPVHVKLDTGMGRSGLSELAAPVGNVVGLMSHLATADSDLDFARAQVRRFRELTDPYPHLTRHIANSAATLRLPEARFDAARCGVALYGLSPFGANPADDGLEPVLRWESRLALVKRLERGQSTGYGRLFTAERPTWIGIVPVGYADGFRRSYTGTTVLVDGEPRRVVGTISMDSFAVELERELPQGTPVVLLGDGVRAEAHAQVAGTINYEVTCAVSSDPRRADRTLVVSPNGSDFDAAPPEKC